MSGSFKTHFYVSGGESNGELPMGINAEQRGAVVERLVGLDEHKKRFLVELESSLPGTSRGVESQNIARMSIPVAELQRNRVPLVLSGRRHQAGKTALLRNNR
ncbi:MAG: hypothetical protein U0Z53_00165 [Blastocatellia bacterium]